MVKVEDRFYKLHHSYMPGTRMEYALAKGTANNWLMSTWGGIGDQICAEPTLRYALSKFKGIQITLASENPELFSHLNFHDVYNLKTESPIMDDYIYFETIPNQDKYNLTPQFLSHMLIHCIDYPSLAAFKKQLPIIDREIKMNPAAPENPELLEYAANEDKRFAYVHAGRHWKSKTFPASYWNSILSEMRKRGFIPILIGKDDGASQGYVDVDPDGCIDLRDKTTLSESIWLLKNASVLVCNDSSPLHMAACGNAFIGFIATVKHQDYLYHFRNGGKFGWRMSHLNLGGLWDHVSYQPNIAENLNLDEIEDGLLETFLPEPSTVADWAAEANFDYYR